MADTQRLAAALSGRYAVERELGAGGMATVYLARDLKHDREVALKVLRPELGAVLGAERFLAEIKITARLDHPHILTLIDSGQTEGFLWYVLPYIRGESLRDRLNREKQLGLDEALAITKQVAGALDYAHRQGVVHRDIKPENILLHEGEAMLADFGIALAVKEAGGNRLTETGLSLGTPQYMSPEQATGDRQLDARSDVYSLAAVLYEMLAGEPPVTGPTAQAMIAKLMTERPTRLRIVRNTVPEGVDNAVAKALAKVPADRFAGASDFAAALQAPGGAAAGARGQRPLVWAGVLAVLAVAVVSVWAVRARLGAVRPPAVALSQRTQLTFTGNVLDPALSPDGKELAFFTKTCTQERCAYAIEVQDVGGSTTRPVLDGATAAYALVWSPDRRNLITVATIGGRYGRYLVSAQGGTPRFITSGAAGFYADGDSLLVGPPLHSDSVFWLRVTSLDGVVGDSIRVAGPGSALIGIVTVPGARWILTSVLQGQHALWQVVDRKGRVTDRALNTSPYADASRDAIWFAPQTADGSAIIIRESFDSTRGRLGSSGDTIITGAMTNFDVTADGNALVYDDGTYDYGVWDLDVADAFRGRLPGARRVLRSSSAFTVVTSPDGLRLLVRRTVATANGGAALRLSVIPFDGGAETPLSVTGALAGLMWADSVTAAVSGQTGKGTHLALLDVRTGVERQGLDLPDSLILDFAPVRDGWAWIPAPGDRIVVEQGGRRREIPKPPWLATVFNVNATAISDRIAITGWNLSTFDTLGFYVIGTDGSNETMWGKLFAESGAGRFNSDGTLQLTVFQTQDAASLYRVPAPGKLVRLGTVPLPVAQVSASADLRRLAVVVRDYHGDVWMSRVVKR